MVRLVRSRFVNRNEVFMRIDTQSITRIYNTFREEIPREYIVAVFRILRLQESQKDVERIRNMRQISLRSLDKRIAREMRSNDQTPLGQRRLEFLVAVRQLVVLELEALRKESNLGG